MALAASIFDIVMDQGKIVDELYGRSGGYGLRRITTHRLAAEKAKNGTNELARFFAARMPPLILPAQMIP
jgi:hypothetical protein